MALVDDIEFFGRAVDAGDMPRDGAVAALAKASGGGLTEDGAATLIDGGWKTARGSYRQSMSEAAKGLDRIYGLEDL